MFHTYVRATSGNTVDFDRATFLMDRDLLGATLDALREVRDGWDTDAPPNGSGTSIARATGRFTARASWRTWIRSGVDEERARGFGERKRMNKWRSRITTRAGHRIVPTDEEDGQTALLAPSFRFVAATPPVRGAFPHILRCRELVSFPFPRLGARSRKAAESGAERP